MTSHQDSHTTTDVKLEIIPGVLTGNGVPDDKYDISGISYEHTNRNDAIFMQRRLFIDEAHTALDIIQKLRNLLGEKGGGKRNVTLSLRLLGDCLDMSSTI